TLGLWLGLLLGDRARFEPTVAAAKKQLAAACALHPIALVIDGADRADGALRSLLLALAPEPAWKQRGLLVVAAAPEQLEPVPRAGAEFSGCVPRPSLRAARAAIAQLPDSQRSSVGFAAVLWPELGTRALAGYEETLVADGLVVVEKLGLRVSQLALVRAAER